MAKPKRLSPEARERMSRLAHARHEEGAFSIGRPKGTRSKERIKRERANRVVAEAARQEAEEIVAVFKDCIHPRQPSGLRLRAAESWIKIAADVDRLEVSEEQHQENVAHSREELLAKLSESLTQGPTASLLRRQIETETGVIDAEVVE